MLRPSSRRALAACAVLLLFQEGRGALAQELSVLDAARERWIRQEVSGDAAFEHVRFMSQFHRPRGGSDGLWRVAEYYETKAREYGLSDVRLIRQEATNRPWNARFADLWIVGDRPERLASTLQTPVHLADHSRAADVTAELVDAGGGSAEELDAAGVAGKVVLTWGSAGAVMRAAVCERGAAGVIVYPSPFATGNGIDGGGFTRPDQVRWTSIQADDAEDCAPTFAFALSLRQGLALRERLEGAAEPVRVHARVDAAFTSGQGDEPWQVMVEAFLRGSDPAAEGGGDVVLTGHLQEEATSANDDASGCASTLEVARALARLVGEGRLPRPKRDLRFWWTTEISSERQYFADHPEEVDAIWVNVNQDMVGADQSQDILRKQCVTRVPATRFHLLNDVTEAVVEHLVAGNTFELAQLQAGIPLYPEPDVAHRGTWHRYNAEMIWFHNNTDHMTFTEAPIGIPGVTFTNMPDRYIHSSDDDLWNIDPTQLERNATAVALIAYAMAAADERSVPALSAEVVGRGAERLGRNLGLGLAWIAATAELAEDRADERAAAWHAAQDQVAYAAERERRALRSLREIGADQARVAELLAGLARRESAASLELADAWRRASGGAPPPPRAGSEAEVRLAELRPALVGGPKEFLDGRSKIGGVPGLHDLMAAEVLSAVDGTRTGLAIHRFVAAEAREAGERYYGTVAPAAVLACLENAAAAGLIRLE